MKNIFSGKNIIILGIIVVLIIVAICLFCFKFYDFNRLHPSVKAVFSKLPILKNKVASEQFSEMQEDDKIFEEEKERIEEEWLEIEKQKQEIKNKESELLKKQAELEALEQELEVVKGKLETQMESIKDLAQYYELMEARNAAKILENIEDDFLIQLFQNMKKETVSEILSNLDPQKAASITKKMSGL